MRIGHPEICLYQPEIPQNTGNIGRLAAATASRLHLIRPFGFTTSDKNLRRAGLDYWPYLDLEIHDSLAPLVKRFEPEEIAILTTKSARSFRQINQRHKLLIFGSESKGLPPEIHSLYGDNAFSIPMYHSCVRSLNLSNAVAIVLYHKLTMT